MGSVVVVELVIRDVFIDVCLFWGFVDDLLDSWFV